LDIEKDKEKFKLKTKEIRETVLKKFEEFKSSIKQKYATGKIFDNPYYLTKRGFYTQNIDDLNKAIELDEYYSFATYYNKARVLIEKDNQDKQGAYTALAYAKQNILDIHITILDGTAILLGINDITNNDQDTAIQIKHKLELLKKQVEYIDRAMDKIKNSSEKEAIEVSKNKTSLTEAFDDEEDRTSEIKELNAIGIIELFEVDTYKISSGGWFGTIFSAVLGVVQIVVGAAITVGSAGFAASFGTGMIVEGVKDIIASIKSVISGKPISLEGYLEAKGISYAINVLTSALTSFRNALTGVKDTVKVTAEEAQKGWLTETVRHELIMHGSMEVISYGLDVALGSALDDYRDDIEANVRKNISVLLDAHKNELQKIITSDIIRNKTETQKKLYTKAMEILKKYSSKYHSAGRIIAEEVAMKSHPALATGMKIYKFGRGIDKALEATNEFISAFGNALIEIATNDALTEEKLFETTLIYNGRTITYNLRNLGIIYNNKFIDGACDKLKTTSYYTQNTLETCLSIYRARTNDYKEEIEAFRNSLVDSLTNSIMGMIRGEILPIIINEGAYFGATKLTESLEAARQSTQSKIKEVSDVLKEEAAEDARKQYEKLNEKDKKIVDDFEAEAKASLKKEAPKVDFSKAKQDNTSYKKENNSQKENTSQSNDSNPKSEDKIFGEEKVLDNKLGGAARGIKAVFDKYNEYAEKHPNIAAILLHSTQTIVYTAVGAVVGGPAGAIGGAILSGQNSAQALAIEKIDEKSGGHLKKIMEEGVEWVSEQLRAVDSKLTKEESVYLALGVVSGGALLFGFKGEAKQLISSAKYGVKNIIAEAKDITKDIQYKITNNIDLDNIKVQEYIKKHSSKTKDHFYMNDKEKYLAKYRDLDSETMDFLEKTNEYHVELEKIPPLRQEYEKRVLDIKDIIIEMRVNGKSWEEIARRVNKIRDEIKVETKEKTPQNLLDDINIRNIKNSNNPDGPTLDYLRNVKRKTWQEICESACKPGGKDIDYNKL